MTFHKRNPKTAQLESGTADFATVRSQVYDFESVFESHWSRVYGVVYRIVGDPAEAEDIALETFLRLHHRAPVDQRNLTGWLYRVATNLALNTLRAQKRRLSYETEAGGKEIEIHKPRNPGEAVEQADESRQVRQTLARMKKRSAMILILRHSGFTYAEIAKAVGVTASSVGTLLARAEKEFEKHYRAIEDWIMRSKD